MDGWAYEKYYNKILKKMYNYWLVKKILYIIVRHKYIQTHEL